MPDYPRNLIEAFDRCALPASQKKVFLTCQGREFTYHSVCDVIRRLAGLFAAWGVRPGDRIAFSTADDAHASILFLGMLRSGVTAVFLDPETGPHRARHLLDVAKPKAVIADAEVLDQWGLPSVSRVLRIDYGQTPGALSRWLGRSQPMNAETYPALLNTIGPADLPVTLDPELDAYVLFTSGTTSDPKGVRITHRNLVSHLKTLSRQFEYSPESRILNVLILSHADGIVQGPLVTFYNSASLYRPMAFTVQRIPDLLDCLFRYRISHFIAVPTMLSLILSLMGPQPSDAFATGDFRYVVSCAAQLETGLWRGFEETFGVRVINLYGLTETVTGGLFAGPDEASHRYGTVGKPVDCEVRIVDEKGGTLPAEQPGELLIRGDNVMRGYLNSPKATRDVMEGDWFHTGDVAAQTRDGCYRILGRKKAIIICGGVNIHPEEITEVLNLCPDVREAVTLGLGDPVWGQRVVSCVVLHAGRRADEESLLAFCRRHLETSKVPSMIRIVPELPRGRSGKIRLEPVREWISSYQQEQGPGVLQGDLESRLIRLASTVFKEPAERLTLTTTPEQLARWDSLGHIEFVVAMEKEFQVRLTPLDIMSIDSLAKAADTVRLRAE